MAPDRERFEIGGRHDHGAHQRSDEQNREVQREQVTQGIEGVQQGCSWDASSDRKSYSAGCMALLLKVVRVTTARRTAADLPVT
jgi:hypothetical protein